ncbi:HLH-domain-containing protein [Neoconidiobolus thromboides FSU 785]|nr:HLH-domain-containing protein [Neoconidiobolus thromboides FSU 785]
MEDKEEDLLEQKRRFHIQSEQKRRAQIRDGFQTLNSLLPNLNRNGKTPSKALILKKAVHYLNGLKGNQLLMLSELERLRIENWNLKQANMFAMKDNNIDEINKNMCFY